jgi:hypothetical protein
MAYFEGEIPVVTTGCNNNNGGWNDWSWIIGLAVVGGIFGNGGFGFGGGNRGNFCGTPATQADLAAGFNNSAVLSSLNDIKLGQANAINYNNQGFAGLNSVINQGFAGVDNAVCTLGYQSQAGFNALGTQLASCCCDIRQAISDCCCTTQRSIDSVKYENAKNTCDIIRAGQDNTRAILDYLTGEKIASLQAENSGLKAQISNDRQSRFIIDELRNGNCPVPAYITCDPRVPVNYSTGCGCC